MNLASPIFCTSESESLHHSLGLWNGIWVQDAVGWFCSGSEGAAIVQGVGSWVPSEGSWVCAGHKAILQNRVGR